MTGSTRSTPGIGAPRYQAIWCQSANGVIGRDGGLPWHEPDDLQHFKDLTYGGTLIMGRRTWESLPGVLPKRVHIVVSSQEQWVATAPSLKAALRVASKPRWVIGGARLFEEAVNDPYCTALHITRLPYETTGDVYAPDLPPQWGLVGKDGPFEMWAQDPR